MAIERDEEAGTDDGRHRAIFEASPDAILVHDVETKEVVEVNEAACELFGKERAELLSSDVGDLSPAGTEFTNERAKELMANASADSANTVEWKISHPEEGDRWVEVRLRRATLEGTERILAYLTELTERKELELDLRRERNLTEQVLETTPIGIVVHDADGKIATANATAEEVLGVPERSLKNRQFDGDEFDLRTVDGEPLHSSDHPFAQIRATNEPIEEQHVSVDTPDGRRILSAEGEPLRDADGEFDGAVMAIKDVTEAVAQEQHMRAEKEHLESVIENLPVILFTIDPDGTFTMSRGSALQKLGLEPGEAVGMTIEQLYGDYPDVIGDINRALEGKEIQSTVEVDDLVFKTWYRPLTDEDGTLEQLLGVSIDITEQRERERKLRDREERLSKIINGTTDAVMIKNRAGEYELINEAGATLFDSDPDEVVGHTASDFLDDAAADRLREHHRTVIETGEPHQYEEEVEIDGDSRVFESRRVPYRGSDGDVIGTINIARDITERKENERRLEENEAILKQLTETTDDVFWLFDADFSEIQFINEAYEEVWGRSIEAIREDPMDFLQGVHPEDRDFVMETVGRLQNGESTSVEYRVNPDEDFERWVSVNGEPIFGEDGDVERAAGYARDVTAQKEWERQLEALSEATTRLSLAQTPDDVADIVVDIADDILDQAITALWEYDETADRLRPWAVTDRAMTLAGVDSIEEMPAIPSGTFEMDVFNDGELRHVDEYGAVENPADPQAPLGSLLLQPIGDRGLLNVGSADVDRFDTQSQTMLSILARNAEAAFQRAEREAALERYKNKLEESNENLQEFAYIASHDLQEPLRSVTSYLDLLESEYGDVLGEDGKFYVERAVTNASQMSDMIDALLQYSRVKTQADELSEVDAGAVLEETLEGLEVLIEERDVDVSTEQLPSVVADRNQLAQLFQNLVKNAIEHGGTPPEVAVTATERDDAWEFAVSDNGPGIDDKHHDRIFEIFQQATGETDSGSGIGLAICERIVSRHGGDIWIESDESGATFRFTIPKSE